MLAGLDQADGAHQPFRRNILVLQAKTEFGGLRLRANEAEERDVLAFEHALDDLEVERVAVRHDEVERAGRGVVDDPGGLFLDGHAAKRHLRP